MTPSKRKKILMLVNLSRISGRALLSFTLQALERHLECQLRIIQVQETSVDEMLSTLHDPSIDGIISSEMEIKQVADFLEKDTRPLVVIGTRHRCIPSRRKNVSFISYNEKTIGEIGAKYLMSLGRFRIFGFVHFSERSYGHLSALRKKGFCSVLDAHHLKWTTFGNPNYIGEEDKKRMMKWLVELPKPAAVMVGCDKRAVEVLDTCAQLTIHVPEDISIVSVDNDEYLCRSTTPPLSSMQTNIGDLSMLAVKEIIRLMSRRTAQSTPCKIIINSHCQLHERASSSALSPGMHLCREAMAFITSNADKCIRVSDVVTHLGVSRRLVDMRFREFQKETILHAITRIRLDEVARRLRTDSSRIGTIINSCGFGNAGHLEALFKRRFGMTPREYRKTET